MAENPPPTAAPETPAAAQPAAQSAADQPKATPESKGKEAKKEAAKPEKEGQWVTEVPREVFEQYSHKGVITNKNRQLCFTPAAVAEGEEVSTSGITPSCTLATGVVRVGSPLELVIPAPVDAQGNVVKDAKATLKVTGPVTRIHAFADGSYSFETPEGLFEFDATNQPQVEPGELVSPVPPDGPISPAQRRQLIAEREKLIEGSRTELLRFTESIIKGIDTADKARNAERFGTENPLKIWNMWVHRSKLGGLINGIGKAALGAGMFVASGSTVLAGPLGMLVAPTLSTFGTKLMAEGATEAVQHFAGGGRRRQELLKKKEDVASRAKAEIALLKELSAADHPNRISVEDLAHALEAILQRVKVEEEEITKMENADIAAEGYERRWRKGIGAVATLGTGLLRGVSFGFQNFDEGMVANGAHHVRLGAHGWGFIKERVGEMIPASAGDYGFLGGAVGHALGRVADYQTMGIGLGAASLALAGGTIAGWKNQNPTTNKFSGDYEVLVGELGELQRKTGSIPPPPPNGLGSHRIPPSGGVGAVQESGKVTENSKGPGPTTEGAKVAATAETATPETEAAKTERAERETKVRKKIKEILKLGPDKDGDLIAKTFRIGQKLRQEVLFLPEDYTKEQLNSSLKVAREELSYKPEDKLTTQQSQRRDNLKRALDEGAKVLFKRLEPQPEEDEPEEPDGEARVGLAQRLIALDTEFPANKSEERQKALEDRPRILTLLGVSADASRKELEAALRKLDRVAKSLKKLAPEEMIVVRETALRGVAPAEKPEATDPEAAEYAEKAKAKVADYLSLDSDDPAVFNEQTQTVAANLSDPDNLRIKVFQIPDSKLTLQRINAAFKAALNSLKFKSDDPNLTDAQKQRRKAWLDAIDKGIVDLRIKVAGGASPAAASDDGKIESPPKPAGKAPEAAPAPASADDGGSDDPDKVSPAPKGPDTVSSPDVTPDTAPDAKEDDAKTLTPEQQEKERVTTEITAFEAKYSKEKVFARGYIPTRVKNDLLERPMVYGNRPIYNVLVNDISDPKQVEVQLRSQISNLDLPQSDVRRPVIILHSVGVMGEVPNRNGYFGNWDRLLDGREELTGLDRLVTAPRFNSVSPEVAVEFAQYMTNLTELLGGKMAEKDIHYLKLDLTPDAAAPDAAAPDAAAPDAAAPDAAAPDAAAPDAAAPDAAAPDAAAPDAAAPDLLKELGLDQVPEPNSPEWVNYILAVREKKLENLPEELRKEEQGQLAMEKSFMNEALLPESWQAFGEYSEDMGEVAGQKTILFVPFSERFKVMSELESQKKELWEKDMKVPQVKVVFELESDESLQKSAAEIRGLINLCFKNIATWQEPLTDEGPHPIYSFTIASKTNNYYEYLKARKEQGEGEGVELQRYE